MSAPPRTPLDGVVAAARTHPGRTALIVNGTPLTYRALMARCAGAASALTRIGVAPGDRVGLWTAAKADFVTGLLGTWAAGAVPVPLPDNDPVQLAELIADTGPTAIVAPEGAVPVRGPQPPAAVLALRDIASGDAAGLSPVDVPDDGLGVLLHSSGTTSAQRKTVEVRARGLCHVIDTLRRLIAVPDGGVEYLVSPPSHAFGLGRLCATLANGGTLVCDDGIFNPLRALVLLREHGCVSMAGVSSAIALLVEKFPDQFADYGRAIRWMEISSAPMSSAHKRRLLEILPQARPFMSYGLTEAMRSAFLDFRAAPGRLETVGRPAPGVEVAVRDGAGNPAAAGQEGEIVVRGANLARGYWRRPDLWAGRLVDGWFRTGDNGRIDPDGFVHFLGRADDVINAGGNKISPEEVEGLIADLLAGTSFCIVGASGDAMLGEVPVLCIEGPQNPEAEAVLAKAVASRLPAWKQPRAIRYFDRLPRTPNGKLLRRELRAMLRAQA